MKIKAIAAVIGGIVLFVALMFTLEVGGLKWATHFNPKWQDVERKTFERNKSYVHGSIQDLGKRYREYTTGENKEEIKNLVAIEFSEFDEKLITNDELRSFLIESRGY